LCLRKGRRDRLQKPLEELQLPLTEIEDQFCNLGQFLERVVETEVFELEALYSFDNVESLGERLFLVENDEAFFKPEVEVAVAAVLRAALLATCFLGAFPPVDFRAVCFVLAI